MNKLKITTYVFILFSFAFLLNSCQSDEGKVNQYLKNASDAQNKDIYSENESMEFNDAIVGLQTKIMIKILDIGNQENVSDMRSLIDELRIEVNESLEILNRISSTEDINNEFKNASIKMFEFYKKSFLEDYTLMIDKIEIINSEDIEWDLRQKAYAEMNEIVENITIEETEMDNIFQEAQEKFAEYNNFLIEINHPLQDDIDAMND